MANVCVVDFLVITTQKIDTWRRKVDLINNKLLTLSTINVAIRKKTSLTNFYIINQLNHTLISLKEIRNKLPCNTICWFSSYFTYTAPSLYSFLSVVVKAVSVYPFLCVKIQYLYWSKRLLWKMFATIDACVSQFIK